MPDPTTIQHALEVAKAAAPGPWRVNEAMEADNHEMRVVNRDVQIADFSFDVEACLDDARFIATFDPETVTALLEAVQAAKERAQGEALTELALTVKRVESLLSSKENP